MRFHFNHPFNGYGVLVTKKNRIIIHNSYKITKIYPKFTFGGCHVKVFRSGNKSKVIWLAAKNNLLDTTANLDSTLIHWCIKVEVDQSVIGRRRHPWVKNCRLHAKLHEMHLPVRFILFTVRAWHKFFIHDVLQFEGCRAYRHCKPTLTIMCSIWMPSYIHLGINFTDSTISSLAALDKARHNCKLLQLSESA